MDPRWGGDNLTDARKKVREYCAVDQRQATITAGFRRNHCFVDYFVASSMGQRRGPERDVAVNFRSRSHSTATERDNRTEDRVAGRSDQEFDSRIGICE